MVFENWTLPFVPLYVIYAFTGAAIVLLIWCVESRWQMWKKAQFEKRFPPISDAEFMERCPAGTNPAVALKVRRIVANQLNIEYGRIYPSSSFVNDLGVD